LSYSHVKDHGGLKGVVNTVKTCDDKDGNYCEVKHGIGHGYLILSLSEALYLEELDREIEKNEHLLCVLYG
jgi:hypothetical protein